VTLLAWRQSRHSTDPELVANALVVVFCGVAVNGLMHQISSDLIVLNIVSTIALSEQLRLPLIEGRKPHRPRIHL
jgi:hypothetical protein